MATNKSFIFNYMTLTYEFVGNRLQDGYLQPVKWSLSVDLESPKVTRNKDLIAVGNRASIAYQRIVFWLETILPGVIVVDVNNGHDLYISNISSNIMMFCPGEPTDDMIVRLIHSKLNALVGNDIIIGPMKLAGNDSYNSFTIDCSGNNYNLPEKTEDYYVEGQTRDLLPWWLRNDGFSFEFDRPENAEGLTDEEIYKDVIDPMDEFENYLNDSKEEQSLPKEPAKIVRIDKWQPKKI